MLGECTFRHCAQSTLLGQLDYSLFLDKRNIGVADLSFEHLSDLIHGITENGLRHASGPVHAKHPIRYIYAIVP